MDLLDLYEQLAKADPRDFERIRREQIEAYIQSLPEEKQDRARRQQWRLETDLNRYKTPTARYNRMVEIFWQGVDDFRHGFHGKTPMPSDDNIVEFHKK